MEELTKEEQLTNYQTLLHIKRVGILISIFIKDLIERMNRHDDSKLKHPELAIFTQYTKKLADSTYGSDEYKQFLNEMKSALDHHYSNNSHHPEHFENGIDGMNLLDLLEMFCDWKAATERHKDGDINKSIEINSKRFKMSDQLVNIFKNTVKDFKNQIDHEQ